VANNKNKQHLRIKSLSRFMAQERDGHGVRAQELKHRAEAGDCPMNSDQLGQVKRRWNIE
jgi:hypothetical protein